MSNSGKEREFNPSVDLFSGIYCQIINSFPTGCYQQNVLEVWDFQQDQISALTLEDVINAVNTVKTSATTGHKIELENLLGGIQRNESGHIIAAGSILARWMVHVNFSEVDHEKHGNLAGTEDWVRIEIYFLLFTNCLLWCFKV